MSNRNTALFAASLLIAAGAVAADHLTSDAPVAVAAQEQGLNPCAAAAPPPAKGERNYDDIAEGYSSGGTTAPVPSAPAPSPAPSPAAAPATGNPCAAGVL